MMATSDNWGSGKVGSSTSYSARPLRKKQCPCGPSRERGQTPFPRSEVQAEPDDAGGAGPRLLGLAHPRGAVEAQRGGVGLARGELEVTRAELPRGGDRRVEERPAVALPAAV